MEPGGVIKRVGSTVEVKTGTWRTFKPVVSEKCGGCGICAQFCPDGCIKIVDGKAVIDYDYCKGCLICMNECPAKAIRSEKEVK